MQIFFWILEWSAYIVGGIILLLFLSIVSYRVYLRNSTKIGTPKGISSLEEIILGNEKQWIFIRGEEQKNQILLFLHGGPGEPMGGMSSSRKLDAKLIKHFTVVHWDQRGAGKSYNKNIPVSSMNFDRWIEDCNELIDYLRNRFNMSRVFLVGHSGGTIVGIKTAQKYPEKIHAYVGVSQFVCEYEKQKIGYDFIVQKTEELGDTKAQKEIEKIGAPPYDAKEKEFAKARYIVKYGGFIRKNPIRKIIALSFNYLTSPEYSFSEGFNTMLGKGRDFSMDARWEEIEKIDFKEEITSLDVPIYFIHGKHDMITPLVSINDFYKALEAPKGKQLMILENSAHVPMIEEKDKYIDIFVNVLLKEIQDPTPSKNPSSAAS
jgi:pimeloyl-ACP methyl ester carboxylesterase